MDNDVEKEILEGSEIQLDEAIESNTDEAMFLEQDMAVAADREAELNEIAETVVVTPEEEEVVIPSDEDTKGEDSDEASAGSEDEAEDEAENTPSEDTVMEILPEVTLTFGEDTVDIVVDENFHLNLRAACQEAGQRADEVAVSGFLDITQEKSLAGATKQ